MSKAFLKVMTDIKKQKVKEEKKKQPSKPSQEIPEDDASSEEDKGMRRLNEMKKKIQKMGQKPQRQWRHDRFSQEEPIKAKLPRDINTPTIFLYGQPGYNKIFPLLKHLKIYIREIDDQKVVFNETHAFLQAKKILIQKGLQFDTNQKGGLNSQK